MTEKRKNYMSYFKCHVCGYSVSISTRWAEVGPPRCLNLKCGNVSKLLTAQISATGRIVTAEPNIQNIPLNSVEAAHIKAAFIGTPTPSSAPYRAKRYDILTKLNGETHESALAIIAEENEENARNT